VADSARPVDGAMRIDVLTICREGPDADRAGEFGGETMVQSFVVPLPGGGNGRVWITTAEALAIPAFGRRWVAARLVALADEVGEKALVASLATGLRLRSAEETAPPAALVLARAA
jgi:hypothetical protein